MARTNSAANAALVTVVDPIACVRSAREGEFTFPKAEQAVRPQAAASGARVTRERFDADDALISFINANGWADLKTQKILDSVRAKGHACGMSRLNKLLGRDSKGNPVAVKAE